MNAGLLRCKNVVVFAMLLFTGTALAEVPLPEGYVRLRYIESTGAQYIDTGVKAHSGLAFDFDLEVMANSKNDGVCGAFNDTTDAGGKSRFLALHLLDGAWFVRYGSTGTYQYNTIQLHERIAAHSELDAGRQTFVRDGGSPTTTTYPAANFNDTQMANLYLFAINYGNAGVKYYSKIRLYGCTFYDPARTVIRNFVPCKDSNGKCGLWDKVEGVFYGNEGTGADFTAPDPIPADYLLVDWIQSVGQQYIDTGFVPTAKTKVEARTRLSEVAQSGRLFGVLGRNYPENALNLEVYVRDSAIGSSMKNALTGDYTASGINAETTTAHAYVLDAANKAFRMDGVARTCNQTDVTGDAGEGRTLFVFACRHASENAPQGEADYFSKQALSFLRLWDNGVLVRDFVPCRRLADGELGLYDCVGGEFHGNLGSGGFRASDEPVLRVTYAQSTGSEYIDTGVPSRTGVIADLVMRDNGSVNNSGVLGSRGTSAQRFFPAFIYGKNGKSWYLGYNDGLYDKVKVVDGTKYTVHGELLLGRQLLTVNGSEAARGTSSALYESTRSLYLFSINDNNGGANYFSKIRLYSCDIYTNATTTSGGTLARRFVPVRLPDGKGALIDLAHDGEIYTSPSTPLSWGGIAYERDGDLWLIYEGTLDDETVFGANEEVVKTSWATLAAGSLASVPPLTVAQGTYSLANGAAGTQIVTGALVLKGGVTLEVDVVGNRSDMLSATAVDLSAVSAERPVRVILSETSPDYANPITLIASGVTDRDAAEKFVCVNAPVTFRVENGALQMVLGSDVLVSAVWTGRGERARDWTDSGNWICVNNLGRVLEGMIPTDRTDVTFPAGAVVDFPFGTSYACRSITFPSLLGGDCDWRGVPVPIDGQIDLDGHKLYLTDLKGAGTLTDTKGGGEVHLDVAKDQRVGAATGIVTLDGRLKLVKEGLGTYSAVKRNHTYTGGTEIAAGVFVAGDYPSFGIYGNASNTNTVRAGAVFDTGSLSGFFAATFVVDGGTLRASSGPGPGGSYFREVILTADSTISTVDGATGSEFGFIGSSYGPTMLNLNGHTLTFRVQSGKSIYMINTTVTGGGTLNMERGGYLSFGYTGYLDLGVTAPDTTLRVSNLATLEVNSPSTIGTYISEYPLVQGWSGDGARLSVVEKFKPAADNVKFNDTTLLDGSTLDLSVLTGVWTNECTFTSYKGKTVNERCTVDFASNATIRVDLGNRLVKGGDQVIAWSEKPSNGVKFKLMSGQIGELQKKPDGLYLQSGLMIIFR